MSDTRTADIITEYGEWLRHEASVRAVDEWQEIVFPFLDQSNDQLCFYTRTRDDVTEFTDDGYAIAALDREGIAITPARRERLDGIARRFGASIGDDWEITLRTDGSRADGMNRFIQTMCDVTSMRETAQRRVAEYFADDVAAALDEYGVFYTPGISVHGSSGFEHSFDFLFQRSASHPTRFCQAPNRFDRETVERIIFAWTDTEKAPERKGSRLVIIADDRERRLRDDPVAALDSYGIPVIPFSQLPERAPIELAA